MEIGANNTLLIALSNLGGKMYNVTHVDGHLEELGSGKQLGKFRRQSFGEPLGPREQRSFRHHLPRLRSWHRQTLPLTPTRTPTLGTSSCPR